MPSLRCPALCLLLAGLIWAGTPVYTTFKAQQDLFQIVRYGASLPTFGFGPSASFDNPALLAATFGQEIGLSLQDAEHPLSIAAGYSGRFLEHAAIGGGLSLFSRDDYLENRALFSFASSGGGVDFGTNVKLMLANKLDRGGYDKTLYAMDVDLGLLVGADARVYAGGAVFNLLSTPMVQAHDFSVSPERSVKLQAGFFLDVKRHYALFTEARVDSLHDIRLKHRGFGIGGEAALLREKQLRLRAGFWSKSTPLGEENRVLFSAGFEAPIHGVALKLEYGLSVESSPEEGTRLVHDAGIGFSPGHESDFLPPTASVNSDDPALILDAGKRDHINLLIHCEDNPGGSGIKRWALTIGRKIGNGKLAIVKAFTGTGLPPRVIPWDGRDSGRQLLGKGVYFYQLRVLDRAGNSTDTPPQPIRLD